MSLGIGTMRGLLSTGISIKQMENTNQRRISMEGKSDILKSEIEQDKKMGLNTKEKEEELADMKDSINQMSLEINEKFKGITNKIEETNKIQQEEIKEDKEQQEVKEDKKQEEIKENQNNIESNDNQNSIEKNDNNAKKVNLDIKVDDNYVEKNVVGSEFNSESIDVSV